MRRMMMAVLVVSIIVPSLFQPAVARSLTEEEAIYVGQTTTLLTVAATSLTNIVLYYDDEQPEEIQWWFKLAGEFGAIASVAESADLVAPRAFRSTHQLFKENIKQLEEVGRDGMAAVIAQDFDDLTDVVNGFIPLAENLTITKESMEEDLAWIREGSNAQDAAQIPDESSGNGESSGTSGRPSTSSAENGASSSSDGTVTLKGTGSTVSSSIRLDAGRYKVTAKVNVNGVDGFAVWIYGPGDSKDLLFNEVIEQSGTGTWSSSQVFEAGDGGSFYVETTNTESSWTLTFDPL